MGKKVDLNAPRETNINVKQHHNIHQNVANNNPTDLENDGQSSGIDNIKNLGSLGKQKVIEEGLKSAGVPASIANWASKNQRVQNAANIHMPKGIIKFAMTITMTMSIVLIMAAPIIFLMVFVVLFGGSDSESSSSGAGSGTFTYGQTCEMITVYNTGCDGNAQNCSNAYDGTVDLETYVAGVINAEIGPAPNDLEYYKVVAIAARSYVLNHISSSCRVPGNSTFQGYMTYGGDGIIKQAAEETKGLVLVKDEQIIDAEYSSACVVNADETDYWIRYGSKTLGNPKIQKVPKEWDSNESAFKGFLARWYSMINKSDTNYETKPCPNNHDNGMSQLGALYLTTKENYSYDEVINYYYGDEIKILKTERQLPGVNGFINPTKTINCSSPFGMRIHPVDGVSKFHNGIDITVDEPIYAAKSGTVSSVTKNITIINAQDSNAESGGGAGNNIVIDHGDGTSTVYMHIKYGSIPDSIYEGATVEQGQKIGHTGSTGKSTGVHLHYGVKVNGEYVDPSDYLNLTNATGTCIHE